MRSLKVLALAVTTVTATLAAIGTTTAQAVYVELSPPVVIQSDHHRDVYTAINSRQFKRPTLTMLLAHIRATPSATNNAAADMLARAIRAGDVRADFDESVKSKGTKRKQPGPDTPESAAAGADPDESPSSAAAGASSNPSSSSSASASSGSIAGSSSSASSSSNAGSSSHLAPLPTPFTFPAAQLPTIPTSQKIDLVLRKAQTALAKGDAGAAQRELAAIAEVSSTALVAEDGPVSLQASWRELQTLRNSIHRGGLGVHVYFTQPQPNEAGREIAHLLFLANQEATRNNLQAAQHHFNTAQTKFVALAKTAARPEHGALVKRWRALIGAVETKIARDESFAREIFGPTGVPQPVEIGYHPDVLSSCLRFWDPPNPKTTMDFDLDTAPYLPAPRAESPIPARRVVQPEAWGDSRERAPWTGRPALPAADEPPADQPAATPDQAGLPVNFYAPAVFPVTAFDLAAAPQ